MAKSLDRYFVLMPMGRGRRPTGERLWRPAADVYQTSDGWIVKLDLAGIQPDDLEIEIKDTTLRVSGCRRDSFYGEGVAYQQLEITYSRFERQIHFPCQIEGARLARDYRDGLLIIHLKSDIDCKENE